MFRKTHEVFKNRQDAGKRLLAKLQALLSKRKKIDTVVVALPRGGVPVASPIAMAIKAPLTVFVSKKIGAPFQPEFAIGAVSSSGVVVLNDEHELPLELMHSHIEKERKRLSEITKETEMKFIKAAGLKEQFDFNSKRVIVIDDGVATGMTTLAACRSLKEMGAADLILATPVLAWQTKETLSAYCDEIVAVLEPRDLSAIGLYYEDFHQVADDEVREALAASAAQN